MKKLILGLASAAALTMSFGASAALSLSVGFDGDQDGNWDSVVLDNGAGDIDFLVFPPNPIDNLIQASFGEGFSINFSSLAENPFNLHMTASMGAPGSVNFAATVTGLTEADLGSLVFSATQTGVEGPASVSAYVDYSNGGLLVGSPTPGGLLDIGAIPFNSAQFAIDDPDDNEFSLTLVVSMNNLSGGASIDSEINVPEPSVIALFGAGLIGVGLARRRMKR